MNRHVDATKVDVKPELCDNLLTDLLLIVDTVRPLEGFRRWLIGGFQHLLDQRYQCFFDATENLLDAFFGHAHLVFVQHLRIECLVLVATFGRADFHGRVEAIL